VIESGTAGIGKVMFGAEVAEHLIIHICFFLFLLNVIG